MGLPWFEVGRRAAEGGRGADMDKYEVVRKIGVGSYGSVFQVKFRKRGDNSQACLKKIRMDNVSPKERAAAHQEVKLLASLNHPYVLKYNESFQYQQFLCIVTEFCEAGDLYHWLKKQRTYVKEDVIIDMFSQIVLAVKYVHDKKVLHRDLKTQNVFLHRDGTIKLGDFGIARVLRFPSEMARTVIGTPYYMSPEIMESRPYEFKSDLWALGCVLYEMTSLKHAFDAQDMNGLVVKILRGKALPTPSHYSAELKGLISKLLAKNPKHRPQMEDIITNPALEANITKHRAFCDEARRNRLAAQQAANAAAGGAGAGNNAAAAGAQPQQAAAAPPAAPVRREGPVAGAGDRERLREQARARLQREIRREESERQLVEANMRKLAERRERHHNGNPGGPYAAPPAGRRAARGPAAMAAADAAAANLVAPAQPRDDPVSLEAELAKAEHRLREIQRKRNLVREQRQELQREWQAEREQRVEAPVANAHAAAERHAAERAMAQAAAVAAAAPPAHAAPHAAPPPERRRREEPNQQQNQVAAAFEQLAREEAMLSELTPKERMRKRKELENRRRELQLLEARKRYFEERKVADYKAKLERGIVPPGMSEPPAPPPYNPWPDAAAPPPAAAPRRQPATEDSDDDADEDAAHLQRYHERHKMLTMRINELQDEAKKLEDGGAPERAVATMDEQERARGNALSLSSSDSDEERPAQRIRGENESRMSVALPAQALEGGANARAQALRQVLEQGIGAPMLDKLTREVQKHHAMKGDGEAHDAEEEYFWAWIKRSVGKSGESFIGLLDQYAFLVEEAQRQNNPRAPTGGGPTPAAPAAPAPAGGAGAPAGVIVGAPAVPVAAGGGCL